MGDHGDGVKCGQDSNLSQCECDEMCTRSETMRARSVELFVGVHVVKRHAIVDVLCGPVVNVVIGVYVFVLSVPLVVVRVVPILIL